jgi:hypothetical protein
MTGNNHITTLSSESGDLFHHMLHHPKIVLQNNFDVMAKVQIVFKYTYRKRWKWLHRMDLSDRDSFLQHLKGARVPGTHLSQF